MARGALARETPPPLDVPPAAPGRRGRPRYSEPVTLEECTHPAPTADKKFVESAGAIRGDRSGQADRRNVRDRGRGRIRKLTPAIRQERPAFVNDQANAERSATPTSLCLCGGSVSSVSGAAGSPRSFKGELPGRACRGLGIATPPPRPGGRTQPAPSVGTRFQAPAP